MGFSCWDDGTGPANVTGPVKKGTVPYTAASMVAPSSAEDYLRELERRQQRWARVGWVSAIAAGLAIGDR
jgi:hypothetical protein